MQVRDGGVWKTATPSARVAGVWKPVQEVWVKDAGVWKKEWQNFTPALSANMTVGVLVYESVVTKGYNSGFFGSISSTTISVPGKAFTIGTCLSSRLSGGAPTFSMTLNGSHTQADVDLLNTHARQVFINGVLLQENTGGNPPVPITPSWWLDAKYGGVSYGRNGSGVTLVNDPIDLAASGTILSVKIGI